MSIEAVTGRKNEYFPMKFSSPFLVCVLVCVAPGFGCATFQPVLGDSCRDSATGRYTSCSSGTGSLDTGTALAITGVVAVGAGLAGLGYLLSSRPSTPTQNTPPPVPFSAECGIWVREVQVCRSTAGYLFAHPSVGICPQGSTPVRVVPVSCSDVDRPAYHACLSANGSWTPVRSWETCSLHGMTAAPGDFVPPGRSPEQGVAP